MVENLLPCLKGSVEPLLHPDHLYTRAEVLTRPCPVPARPGVYAWYFNRAPGQITTSNTHQAGGCSLLYLGISPKAPPENGRSASRLLLHCWCVRHRYP